MPKDEVYDPTTHLTVADIAMNNTQRLSSLQVPIRQLKSDLLWKGIYLYVGKMRSALCPVEAMLQHLRLHGMGMGALFCYKDG